MGVWPVSINNYSYLQMNVRSPKAGVTGSNPVGRAKFPSIFSDLQHQRLRQSEFLMTQQLKINHDPEAFGRTLQQVGRLQVSNLFTQDSADYLYKIHMENKGDTLCPQYGFCLNWFCPLMAVSGNSFQCYPASSSVRSTPESGHSASIVLNGC